ncbi:hypothetical protein PG997_003404 [Apiospora hydei]|uniref:Acetylornithine aminotransferase n=1 Tax=Apiospora hydei TaxID=1337664 RepID=A0ABR1WZ63_9PEZI
MSPNLVVLADTGSLTPNTTDDTGAYSDLVGSRPDASSPIVAGIWDLVDRESPTEAYAAEWDEMKYVVKGTAVITDELAQRSFELKPGSLLWIPKGSKGSFLRSAGFSAIYVEQRHGEGPFQSGGAETEEAPAPPAPAPAPAPVSDVLQRKLATLVADFAAQNPSSLAAHQQAQTALAGGNTRAVLHGDPFPLYIESGRGPHLCSLDGREYLDLVSDYSAALFGHSNPVLADAVARAASSVGFNLGGATRRETELARRVQARFPSIERVRFCNSGTEANTFALAAAMEFTKRTKILVFDNGYHGGTLSFGSRTNPLNLPHDFIFGTYNDIDATRAVLATTTTDGDVLAAILVEPMLAAGGQVPARRDFLAFLRRAATETGALLVFDEVVTSRLHYRGLQGHHGVRPDMTTLGKYLGGGLPFGAFGGRADIMGSRRLAYSGTFNNNVFTMTAALAAADLVTEPEIDRINALSDGIRDGIAALCSQFGFSGLKATGFGSAVGLHFSGPHASVLRECFFFDMLQQGIYVGRRGFVYLNLTHTARHSEQFLVTVEKFLAEVK